MRVTHNKADAASVPGYGMRLPPRVRLRTNVRACMSARAAKKKGESRGGCLAQRARGAPAKSTLHL